MRVEWFVVADAIDSIGGKINIQGAPVDRITARELPARVPSLAAAVGLMLDDEDRQFTEDRNATFGFVDETGASVGALAAIRIPVQMVHDAPQTPDVVALVAIASLQVEFPSYGVYRLRFSVEGKVISSRAVEVRSPSPEAVEAELISWFESNGYDVHLEELDQVWAAAAVRQTQQIGAGTTESGATRIEALQRLQERLQGPE